MKNTITILGTGAWGTALANVLLDNGHQVNMWGIDEKEINDLKNQKNTKYFQDTKLSKPIHLVTNNLQLAIKNSEVIILAIPSKFLVNILQQLKLILKNRKVILINVAKGIDIHTKHFWSEIIKKNLSKNEIGYVSLLGPSFASEVFHKEFTMINVVGSDVNCLTKVQSLFNNNYFKLIQFQNELGADIFAALKNVAAIGTGIIYSLYHSINTRSAFLSCLFKEIYHVYLKITNRQIDDTLIGYELCASGDLILTCTSEKSRNFSFGLLVGEIGIEKALKQNNKTIEGYVSAKIIYEIINNKKINVPILIGIYKVLYENLDPNKLIYEILV